MRSQLEDKTYKEQELNTQLIHFSKSTESQDEGIRRKIEMLERENQQLNQSLHEKNESFHNLRVKVVINFSPSLFLSLISTNNNNNKKKIPIIPNNSL